MALFTAIGLFLASNFAAVVSVVTTMASFIYQRKRQKKQEKEQDKLKGFDITVDGDPIHVPLVYGYQSIAGVRTYHATYSRFLNARPDTNLGWVEFSFGASNDWNADYDPNWVDNESQVRVVQGGRAGGEVIPISQSVLENRQPGVQTQDNNNFLIQQQALCFGGIDGVIDLEVNGQSYNKGEFSHKIDVNLNGGVAHPAGTYNGVPATNLFTNMAYAHSTFLLDRDNPNYNGVPDVTAFVRGQRIFAIVESEGGNYSLGSKRFSNNSAEVLLDYLLRPKTLGGVGLGDLTASEWLNDDAPNTDRVDLASFARASAISGTVVETISNAKGRVNGISDIDFSTTTIAERDAEDKETGTTAYVTDTDQVYVWDGSDWQVRPYIDREILLYECNITIDTERDFRDNIELILETMNEADLIYTGGQYKMVLEYPTTALEQESIIAATYDDSYIVSDSVQVLYPGSNERHNRIICKFNNEELDFKTDSVSWPNFNDANHLKLIAEDGQVISTNEVFLPGCTTRWNALAKAETY